MSRRIRANLRRFASDEVGSSMVEFALIVSLFFLLMFGLIDFGRIAHANVMAEKATETAVRMAVVRRPACEGVEAVNGRGIIGAVSLDLPNGTPCSARVGLCVPAQPVSCDGDLSNPTVAAVWARVADLLPAGTAPQSLRFSYTFEPELNRVAAPYNPVVSVELRDVSLDFIFPLAALASASGAQPSEGLGAPYQMGAKSASLPAETIR